MRTTWIIYRRWLRDRRLSTSMWALGLAFIAVLSAAFYPSLSGKSDTLSDSSGAMSSLLGLSSGIDPSSPLGFLWISLYANVVPMTLMALGVALGAAAISSDEESGTLEYLLARPVGRTSVTVARFLASVTILFLVAAFCAVALAVSLPLFDLTDSVTTVLPDGTKMTSPGATPADIAAGTFAAFALGLGILGVAFGLGASLGRKGVAMGASAAFAVGGYALYTLSDSTDSLEALTWISPWRWYIEDAMLIDGLTWAVALPFALALLCFLIGWQVLLRRDLRHG